MWDGREKLYKALSVLRVEDMFSTYSEPEIITSAAFTYKFLHTRLSSSGPVCWNLSDPDFFLAAHW